MLYPFKKKRLQLIRARPESQLINDNNNVSLGTVDCSLYIYREALTEKKPQKRMDMTSCIPVEFSSLETLDTTLIILIIPVRQNQSFPEHVFNNALGLRITIATKTSSAFDGSYNKHQVRYQKIDLEQIPIFKRGQPIEDFGVAEDVCL